jgi:hypothetical protein
LLNVQADEERRELIHQVGKQRVDAAQALQ